MQDSNAAVEQKFFFTKVRVDLKRFNVGRIIHSPDNGHWFDPPDDSNVYSDPWILLGGGRQEVGRGPLDELEPEDPVVGGQLSLVEVGQGVGLLRARVVSRDSWKETL